MQHIFDKSTNTQKITYKTELEKFTLQIEEWNREKKEREVIYKKYETAKKKLVETVTSLDEIRTTNRHYQQQVNYRKGDLCKYSTMFPPILRVLIL